ncbi:MAG: hypothetical protein SGILL_001825 [Bacillariaceae sp.]
MEYSAFAFPDPSISVCIPPPAKRSRKEELSMEAPDNMINWAQKRGDSQSWKRMRDARRASLTYLMDCGASPITLDFAIDKRIFDFTVVTSNVAAGSEKAPPRSRCSQLPPPPFSDNDTPAIRQVSSSDDALISTAIAATTTFQNEIEKECSAPRSNKRKMDGIEGSEARFRAHQTDIWVDKYEDLVQYKTKNGHCLVPNSYPPNPSLAEWVKRQRYQYKLRVAGKHSSMTDDRVAALEKLEFCWNSHDANWEDKFAELVDYKRRFGHTNVPSTSQDFPKLAVWVKRQRRQYKFLMEGQASTVTPYRKEKLESIGFSWSGRKPKKGSRQARN